MFSRPSRMDGSPVQYPEGEVEPLLNSQRSVPCRVKVVTRGLACTLAGLAIGLAFLAHSSPSKLPASATCEGFGAMVRALGFPASGRTLSACIAEGTLISWNRRSSHARVGGTQEGYVLAAEFSPDGSTAAIADADGVVSLWNLNEWKRWAGIAPRGGLAKALAFNRNGTTLATADRSGVRLWDLTTSPPSAGPHLTLNGVLSVKFAPDGQTLAVGTVEGTVHFWDLAQKESPAQFRAHPSQVMSLAFTSDGRILATASPSDRIVRLWDAEEGRPLKAWDVRSPIQAVAFAPGDRELATAGLDGAVWLWTIATGETRGLLSEGDGPIRALAFSPDGEALACGGTGSIRLYPVKANANGKSGAPQPPRRESIRVYPVKVGSNKTPAPRATRPRASRARGRVVSKVRSMPGSVSAG